MVIHVGATKHEIHSCVTITRDTYQLTTLLPAPALSQALQFCFRSVVDVVEMHYYPGFRL